MTVSISLLYESVRNQSLLHPKAFLSTYQIMLEVRPPWNGVGNWFCIFSVSHVIEIHCSSLSALILLSFEVPRSALFCSFMCIGMHIWCVLLLRNFHRIFAALVLLNTSCSYSIGLSPYCEKILIPRRCYGYIILRCFIRGVRRIITKIDSPELFRNVIKEIHETYR